MKSLILPFMLALACAGGVRAFPCRTEYGAVEVPGAEGFTPGDSSVRRNIQRTRRAIGGQNGKVVCVLVPKSEADGGGPYSELLTLSQSAMTNAIDDAAFEGIARTTREQIAALREQVVNGLVFGNFHQGRGYYFNTMEVIRTGDQRIAAFTVMGGIHLRGHLFSFVAHTTADDPARRAKWISAAKSWAEGMVAGNAPKKASGGAPLIATFANIDDFKMLAFSLGKTERIRTRDRERPDAVDVKFEYSKLLQPRPGGGLGYPTLLSANLDGFNLNVGVGDAPISEGLDGELDAFSRAGEDAAAALADGLAGKIAAERGQTGEAFDSGFIRIGGRNGLWRDSWLPGTGDGDSPQACRTFWVQLAGRRVFEMQFLLQDTFTAIVPVADLNRLNVGIGRMVQSLAFQNRRQLKR